MYFEYYNIVPEQKSGHRKRGAQVSEKTELLLEMD